MSCSCKAGLSEACKHVVATLLFCNRNDVDKLSIITCTDKKCIWSAPHKAALEKYEPNPLGQHSCYELKKQKNLEASTKKHKKTESQVEKDYQPIILTQEDNDKLLSIMVSNMHFSALAEHIAGRHDVIEEINNNSTSDPIKINAIFQNQRSSKFLNELEQVKVNPLKECCQKIISNLSGDVVDVGLKTMEFHSTWLKERQLRITGSDSYQLFTYNNNKNPDWRKKSIKYFYSESVVNCYTQHGLKNEPLARNLYDESEPSYTVIECGLVVCHNNSWLGFSPDGVVFDSNNIPVKLIEIKCPYEGKKNNFQETLQKVKWLVIENGQITLKKKHLYYAQIQIGMAVFVVGTYFWKTKKDN
ncbi:uncharacterized protein LOC141528057 isoform X2 [Cotesia typhae]